MTPRELLAMEPEFIEHSLSSLVGCNYDFIPEAEIEFWELSNIESARIEIKVYKHFNFDVKRFWRLASVWLDNNPVMIVCNAGRDGEDSFNRFVVDKNKYRDLVISVKNLTVSNKEVFVETVDLDKDMPEMTEFYGNKLGGYFSK